MNKYDFVVKNDLELYSIYRIWDRVLKLEKPYQKQHKGYIFKLDLNGDYYGE